jgi:hypothetical protein
MTAPGDKAAAARGEASDPSDLQDFRERLAYIRGRAWTETKVTLLSAWGQLQRLFGYCRAWWTSRRLEQKYLAAQIALGERLEAASLGEAPLRQRLADLRERRQSFVAAKESTRALDAEIRGLHVRLAEPLLESVQAPAEVESQHRRALAVRMEIADRRASQVDRRAALFPADSETRIRTAAGLGVFVVLASMVCSMFFGSENVNGLLLPPSVDLESLQPLASFTLPEAPSDGPSTMDVEADSFLPARKVSVTFVDGRPEGEVRCVDVRDRVICVETYRHGLLHGTRERFYPGGEKFSELRFVDGIAQGEELVWFANGKLAAKTSVVDGLPHGAALINFENGRKCVSTTYVQGRPHGQRAHYRPDEVCFAIIEWQEGRPVSQQFLQIDVTADDVAAIEERGSFSTRLVDYWND